MPSFSFSSAQAARECVSTQLKDLRLGAHLTMQALADLCGWNKAKTSRIESARTTPSDADIRAWCIACRAEDRADDLIAFSRSADMMYVEWRRTQRTGLRSLQQAGVPLYERTALIRAYCSRVVPGLLQTEDYARALLTLVADFRGLPDDVDEAAAARVARSRVVRDGHHRVVLLVEEDVLFQRIAADPVMTAQLAYLRTAMTYPAVSLGIVPSSAPRVIWGIETFTMFDDVRVHVELLSAKVTVTVPGEVLLYQRAFARISRMAVYGPRARALIDRAIDSRGSPE
ncbi:Scr1 family TA system antitoxin-like transcriptional regulator [Streptomyces paludis]|uniref:XRE family transcriptional regulator n=1 Tax=Streptomyces paludis TaxID=2282738 RepID=A0A345HNE2_9ACTN|nr:Scr1 family TA system antitoxin-like transcriptional regulator [Streptomyces paludis]AXG78216.1 XRE family transcriptional regulator [Streptomyces paludis]